MFVALAFLSTTHGKDPETSESALPKATKTEVDPSPSLDPSPTITSTPTPTNQEIYAITPDGTPLHWLVYTPTGSGPWPAALVIHVGGFRAAYPGSLEAAQDLAAAGYLALAIEYHLAPPAKPMPQQVTPGYYPLQTDDVRDAIMAASRDPRCNGKVVAAGGSAGASHAAYCAATGTLGLDRFDAAVCLSGAYDFGDAQSLGDALRRNFKTDVQNYVNTTDVTKLLAASPVTFVTDSISPLFLVATNNDPMPFEQLPDMVDALQSAGAADYQQLLITEPNGPDGFTRHAFEYWSDVKNHAIAFLNNRLATP